MANGSPDKEATEPMIREPPLEVDTFSARGNIEPQCLASAQVKEIVLTLTPDEPITLANLADRLKTGPDVVLPTYCCHQNNQHAQITYRIWTNDSPRVTKGHKKKGVQRKGPNNNVEEEQESDSSTHDNSKCVGADEPLNETDPKMADLDLDLEDSKCFHVPGEQRMGHDTRRSEDEGNGSMQWPRTPVTEIKESGKRDSNIEDQGKCSADQEHGRGSAMGRHQKKKKKTRKVFGKDMTM